MPVVDLFASLLQHASQGTRSTILNPLAWFFGICVVGLIGSVRYGSVFWIQILLGCFTSLSGILYLGTYIFCLATKRPELLRTEKFLIQQLEIQKRFGGDSATGFVIEQNATDRLLPAVEPEDKQQ